MKCALIFKATLFIIADQPKMSTLKILAACCTGGCKKSRHPAAFLIFVFLIFNLAAHCYFDLSNPKFILFFSNSNFVTYIHSISFW